MLDDLTQAEYTDKIVILCGGTIPAARVLGINPATLYRWKHLKAKMPKTAKYAITYLCQNNGVV